MEQERRRPQTSHCRLHSHKSKPGNVYVAHPNTKSKKVKNNKQKNFKERVSGLSWLQPTEPLPAIRHSPCCDSKYVLEISNEIHNNTGNTAACKM